MLSALDQSLKQLLIAALPIKNGEVDVSFALPNREWATARVKPTINLYLYALRENTTLRRNEWVVQKAQGRATRHQPPRRIDAVYLVTAWGGDAEDEHRLLWRLLAVFLKHPELPVEVRQGLLAETDEPLKAGLLPPEEQPNAAEMWNAIGNDLRPALHYRVVLPLDVAKRFTGPLVLKKVLKVEEGLAREGPFEEIVQEAQP